MLRRLHTRIVGMGSVCGLAPTPPAEVFLKTLPPPFEVDADKFARFQREEEVRRPGGGGAGAAGAAAASASPPKAPEPFFDIVSAGCGHKHIVMVTREGNLVTVGNNQYGQTAAPAEAEEGAGAPTPSPALSGPTHDKKATTFDWSPVYIDLEGTFAGSVDAAPPGVSCGSNFSLVYQRGGRRVVAFGANHMGQLGVGHKSRIDATRGLEAWDPTAAWWPADPSSRIARITSAFNHSVVQLTCGRLYSFGSNIWGELGVGSTTSPMHPQEITYFGQRGMRVRKVAVGNSVTLFLTEDGRVYGCGATNLGQLPPNSFEPVPVPITREFQQQTKDAEAPAHPAPPRSSRGPRLVRIKDVAVVGSLCVFVSTKDELFVQGALPEVGYTVPSPRYAVVSQAKAIEQLSRGLPEPAASRAGFSISEVVPGPSTLLVRYRNGCVAGLGVNTEGQLQSLLKKLGGKAVNLAPASASTELLPVLATAPDAAVHFMSNTAGEDAASSSSSFWASGKGFSVLFDNNEYYTVDQYAKPIELPPGKKVSLAHRMRQKIS